jgi:thiamine-phosphate pyrophosphorylase
MLRLRTLARQSHLTIVAEQGRSAARVHNSRELRRALLARPRMILVSPVHPTGSHPEWKPLSRMRAAALARLAKRRAVALGGMDARRYAKIARLGFIGWAGISAFRT